MKNLFFIALAGALLAGCAQTAVTPVSRNQVIISTGAAPACGSVGAQRVASKMAAVETIRRGFERFVILGGGSANNVSVIRTAPTYATTNATFNTYGNTTYGSGRTTYGGGTTMMVGSHDADLNVLMLNSGDAGFRDAVDARQFLGEKWEELVKNGVNTCS